MGQKVVEAAIKTERLETLPNFVSLKVSSPRSRHTAARTSSNVWRWERWEDRIPCRRLFQTEDMQEIAKGEGVEGVSMCVCAYVDRKRRTAIWWRRAPLTSWIRSALVCWEEGCSRWFCQLCAILLACLLLRAVRGRLMFCGGREEEKNFVEGR
jgi:hypothetical protein